MYRGKTAARPKRGDHQGSSSSRSRSRPGSSSVNINTAANSIVVEPAVLRSLRKNDLHKGFEEVQRKLAQVLSAIEQNDNIVAFVDPNGPVAIGINTLREIATALVEKDPHFACFNKIFEDMWLMGFTRPLKLSNKFDAPEKLPSEDSMKEWRTCFMIDWLGYLSKLQDTLEMFQRPENLMEYFDLTETLPKGFSKSGADRERYQLPITYLLRDIALCIARIHSHVNPSLQKFWMQRALMLNSQIKGKSYREASKELSQRFNRTAASFGILARPEAGDVSPKNEEMFDNLDNQLTSEEGSSPTDSEIVSIRGESTSPVIDNYEPISPKRIDVEKLKPFASRNCFIQGLVDAAKMDGLNIRNNEDSS